MPHLIQTRIFQLMRPEEKLRLAERLYYSAREIKAAGLRLQHPEWSEEAVQKKVREIFLYAGT
jgi:hypothetical protein